MIFFSKINQIKMKMKVSCADHIPICSSKNYLIQVLLEDQNAKLLADGTII